MSTPAPEPSCPRCGAATGTAAVECPDCGVVLAKARVPRAPRPSAGSREPGEGLLGIPREGWQATIAGAAAALLLPAFPLFEMLIRPLVTIVHELGHSAVGWLFGYPSLPAFDFQYGGGVTLHGRRDRAWVFAIAAGLAVVAYVLRRRAGVLRAGVVLVAVYMSVALSPRHDLLIVFMGHGTELVFAGIFVYRGLTGWGCIHAVERPLYAALGFWVASHVVRFANGVAGNAYFRAAYLEGKGGIANDLVQVAQMTGISLVTVARVLVIMALLTPLVAVWAARHRRRLEEVAVALDPAEPD